MARHRKPHVIPTATLKARRGLAACLVGASALTATLLTLTVTPGSPPAPDRSPAAPTAPEPQAAP